jgi:hypothetical protein
MQRIRIHPLTRTTSLALAVYLLLLTAVLPGIHTCHAPDCLACEHAGHGSADIDGPGWVEAGGTASVEPPPGQCPACLAATSLSRLGPTSTVRLEIPSTAFPFLPDREAELPAIIPFTSLLPRAPPAPIV